MVSPAVTLSQYGSPRSASAPGQWSIFAPLLFLAVLLRLAWGSLREPAHADARAPAASAESQWMPRLAALAMAIGALAVHLASPTTIQSPISERTSR